MQLNKADIITLKTVITVLQTNQQRPLKTD